MDADLQTDNKRRASSRRNFICPWSRRPGLAGFGFITCTGRRQRRRSLPLRQNFDWRFDVDGQHPPSARSTRCFRWTGSDRPRPPPPPTTPPPPQMAQTAVGRGGSGGRLGLTLAAVVIVEGGEEAAVGRAFRPMPPPGMGHGGTGRPQEGRSWRRPAPGAGAGSDWTTRSGKEEKPRGWNERAQDGRARWRAALPGRTSVRTGTTPTEAHAPGGKVAQTWARLEFTFSLKNNAAQPSDIARFFEAIANPRLWAPVFGLWLGIAPVRRAWVLGDGGLPNLARFGPVRSGPRGPLASMIRRSKYTAMDLSTGSTACLRTDLPSTVGQGPRR